MKGASIPPTRAHIELAPTTEFLMTVGNNSAEYWYTIAKEAAEKAFPVSERTMFSHTISGE